mgnify:CR=1 FL=1
MISNILDVYNQASPLDIAEGLRWYHEAKRECQNLARRNRITLKQAIGIVAALSPRVNWGRNVIAAQNLVRGIPGEGFGANKVKAGKILEGADPEDILRGDKVTSFYSNILRPSSSTAVTIDRWAIRVTMGADHWSSKVNTPTPKQYLQLGNEYREAAAIVGLKPLELQAITWVTIKRLCGAW